MTNLSLLPFFLAAQKSFAPQHLRREIRRKASQGGRLCTLTTPSPLEIREERDVVVPGVPAGNTTRARHVNNSLGEARGCYVRSSMHLCSLDAFVMDWSGRDNGPRTHLWNRQNSCVYEIKYRTPLISPTFVKLLSINLICGIRKKEWRKYLSLKRLVFEGGIFHFLFRRVFGRDTIKNGIPRNGKIELERSIVDARRSSTLITGGDRASLSSSIWRVYQWHASGRFAGVTNRSESAMLRHFHD